MKQLFLVAVLALGLTSCGGTDVVMPMANHAMGAQGADDSEAQFDHSDVIFAMMMFSHHAQSVEMAAMVDARSADQAVRALANNIADAQEIEMDQFATWLGAWGQPAPPADMGSMGGLAAGMQSADELRSLRGLSGEDFDRAWLSMMIDHHRGAITVAGAEIDAGENPVSVEMASSIVRTQTAEIELMDQLRR